MAMSQKMAVATVLAKPGAPNYALPGRLCMGVAEDLDSSLYLLARSLWTASEYGLAVAAMYEATAAMRTRSSPTGKGLPEIKRNGSL